MDYKTFTHIRSLLKAIRLLEPDDDYLMAIREMVESLKKGKPTKIRFYFGLLRRKEWWYLVFRTHRGSGAYLFLRLLEKKGVDKPIEDRVLWRFVKDPENWKQAEKDSVADEPDDEEEPPPRNTATNNIGPGTAQGGW